MVRAVLVVVVATVLGCVGGALLAGVLGGFIGTLIGLVFGMLWLTATGAAPGVPPGVRTRRERRRLICIPKGAAAECEFVYDARTGRPLDVEECSLFESSSEIRCEKRCVGLMDDVARLPANADVAPTTPSEHAATS